MTGRVGPREERGVQKEKGGNFCRGRESRRRKPIKSLGGKLIWKVSRAIKPDETSGWTGKQSA